MRNFIFAFLGAMGLTLLTLPLAVHLDRRDAGTAQQTQQLATPVGVVAVTEAGQVAADPRDGRAGDQAAQDDRDQNASDSPDKAPAAAPKAPPRAATHRGQKTINVDLSDLVIRPV